MLSQEQVLQEVKGGRKSEAWLDGRDYSRLSMFFPADQWEVFGFALREGATAPEPYPWTEERVKAQLAKDLEFAFEKALNRRGISAGLMYNVVKMWLWVLEDELYKFDIYAQYGLPLFKAVAVKYDFENPIGDDRGDEYYYSVDYGEE